MTQLFGTANNCITRSSTVLAALYALVLLIATVQTVRLSLRVGEWTTQKLFHHLIVLVNLVRVSSYLLEAVGVVVHPAPLFYVLWSLPGCLLLSTFTLLVSTWASTVHSITRPPGASSGGLTPKRCVIYVNTVFYAVQLALFIMLFMPGQFNNFVDGEPLFLGIASLLAAFSFLLYGHRLHRHISKHMWSSPTKQRMTQRIFTVTVVCSFAFAMRALTNFSWVSMVDSLPLCGKATFLVVFYTIIEIVPSLAVLGAMRKMPKRKTRSVSQLLNKVDYRPSTSTAAADEEQRV